MNVIIFAKSMMVVVCIFFMLAVFGCVENKDKKEMSSVHLCSGLTEETVRSRGFERLRYNKEKNCFALHLMLDQPFVVAPSSYTVQQVATDVLREVSFALILSDGGRRAVGVSPVGHSEIQYGVMSSLLKGFGAKFNKNQSTREIFKLYYDVNIEGPIGNEDEPDWRMTLKSNNYLGWVSSGGNKNLLCANPNSKEMRASGMTCRLYVRIFNDVIARMSFRVKDAERAFSDAKEIPEMIKNIIVIDD